jgi:2-oxoisovalerate dehydrogenase E2 component (dihydrolipoyl transacylase)
MGIHVIKMPDIGEGIAEVELVKWHVKPGDAVVEDQVLADVMTDKATVEIPSPVAGTVLMTLGKIGEKRAVGSELIRIEVQGAGNEAAGQAAQAGPRVAAPVAAPEAPPAVPAKPVPTSAPQVAANAARWPASLGHRARNDKPIASPAVRRRAWEMGIELRFVAGSGAAGRILHEDLDAFLARGEGGSTVRGSQFAERNDETRVEVIGLRRRIAEKMQEAKRRIPHFTYVEEIDVTELEALRAQLNETWAALRGRMTLLPLLMRAVVLGVRAFPQVNARYDDDAGVVTRYGAVHLGIATQTDAGLMVPVARHAEARDLWAAAAEVHRLAEAARNGKSARAELSGSTITITSLGALGGIVTTPVINHPEVAIIGVGRIVERPVVRAGAIVVRKMMNLSSSFDHRVVDGADGAKFVQALRGLIEAPATLFVE